MSYVILVWHFYFFIVYFWKVNSLSKAVHFLNNFFVWHLRCHVLWWNMCYALPSGRNKNYKSIIITLRLWESLHTNFSFLWMTNVSDSFIFTFISKTNVTEYNTMFYKYENLMLLKGTNLRLFLRKQTRNYILLLTIQRKSQIEHFSQPQKPFV